jgi:hypothetical protein
MTEGQHIYSITDAARIYGKDSSHFRELVRREGIHLVLTHKDRLPPKRGMPLFVLTVSRHDLDRLIKKRDGHSS